MQAIGIDLGTTSICGVAVDSATGSVLRSVNKNSNAFIDGVADWEKIQSAEKIIATATEILDSLICDDTAVIGVTGQMHGIVYLDSEGNAIGPLYTWQDGRGNLPYGDSTYAKHLGIASGYGCATDFYNRVNGIRPENAVSFCTIHDYFVMKLCSLKTPTVHTSDAASFGCFDLESMSFTNGMPLRVTGDFAILGEYHGIPVSVAIGDNQASVFSCIGEGDVLLNFGTGSQISVISDRIVSGHGIEARPFLDGKYLLVGAALCGGRAYSLLKDFYGKVLSYAGLSLSEGEIYGVMDKMLKDTTDVPMSADTRFAGTREDSSITGSLGGITTENFTPSSLVYAILNGMASELYNMFDGKNIKYEGLVGSGNGIRKNPALVKIIEEKFGMSLRIPTHLEEAAVGAAMFALVACEKMSLSEVRSLIKYN